MLKNISSSIVRMFNVVVLSSIVVGLAAFTLMIGIYNYTSAMTDIKDRANNTGEIAAISAREPLWNYDQKGLDDIFAAVLLDKDVLAIRILKKGEEKPSAERKAESVQAVEFATLASDPINIVTTTQIMREGTAIASVQTVTSTAKVRASITYTSLLVSAFALGLVVVISTFIVFLGRKMIQRPINALRKSAEELAGGNLTYPINTRRKDELGALAVSFDAMRNAIKAKMDVIEDQNRNLEERITERTAELRQKTNDINSMLQNMRQGIFTILPDGTIHPEHSAYLCNIYEARDIARRNVFAFLFANSDVGSDAMSQMVATLDSLLGEDAMMFDFNSHLLIQEYEKKFEDGRSKIIELDWRPVLEADNTIGKLMVTTRDVTELKALQRETEKQKEELDVIGQILSVSQDKLLEFIKTSFDFIDENRALIVKTSKKDLDVIASLFRNMHTVKGNARTYGFTYATNAVHEAETTYSRLRSEEEFEWNVDLLLDELEQVRVCILRYQAVFKEKLAGFAGGEGGISPAILESISAAVAAADEASLGSLRDSVQAVKDSIKQLHSDSLQDVLKGIIEGLPSMATQLGKETPQVAIKETVRIKKDIVPTLRNVFMHVFRNSMDHGLETTEQRITTGKSKQGNIVVASRSEGGNLVIDFSDDGRGLALAKIHQKAIDNGQLAAGADVPDEQIAEMIFLSGVSTAAAVTDVSGRGVGMDAIRKFLNKNDGDVKIVFNGERNEGFRPFRLVVTLPDKFAV